jgi:peptide/nickel transport system permease protein
MGAADVLSPSPDSTVAPAVTVKDRWLKQLWRELGTHPNLAIGGALAVVVVAVAVVGHVAPPHNPLALNAGHALVAPGPKHWLGTDQFGRDVLSRVLYGTGVDLVIGLTVAAMALLLGSAVGLVSGYAGGWVDDIVMRVVDIVMSFPSFLLAWSMAVVLGNTLANVMTAVTIAYVPYILRLTRSSVLSARHSDYVLGARAVGASRSRVMGLHVLPNSIGASVVQATLMSGWAILDVSGLSFLGVGIQPPSPELGVQISQGASYITGGQWWVSIFPGAAIIVAVLAFNFLGDYADDKLRGQGS